jgi:hypothetical protein
MSFTITTLGTKKSRSAAISSPDIALKEKCLPMTVLADDMFSVNEREGISYYDAERELQDDLVQLQLPLESPSELLERYREQIRHFERAHEKMAMYALKWHALLKDVDENSQVAKLFRDLQMVRKLFGSDFI